jgi:hypothetical protein
MVLAAQLRSNIGIMLPQSSLNFLDCRDLQLVSFFPTVLCAKSVSGQILRRGWQTDPSWIAAKLRTIRRFFRGIGQGYDPSPSFDDEPREFLS